MRALDRRDLERLLGVLLDVLGPGWLERHLPQHDEESHPFIAWHSITQKFLDSDPTPTAAVPESAVRVAVLADDIETLRGDEVEGLGFRLEALRTGDAQRFISACHELSCAAEYLRQGHEVTFLPESAVKSADLLVSGVELECKHKMVRTAADLARHAQYGQLLRRLAKSTEKQTDGSGLRVTLFTSCPPDNRAKDEILDAAREILRKEVPGNSLEGVAGGIPYKMWRTAPIPAPNSRSFRIALPGGERERDYWNMQAGITLGVGGGIRNVTVLQVDGRTIQSPSASITKTLKTARAQLSGHLPGVVNVDWTAVRQDLQEGEEEAVRKTIRQVMYNNRAISGVVLTVRAYGVASDEPMSSPRANYRCVAELIVNKDAAMPLSEAWVKRGFALKQQGSLD